MHVLDIGAREINRERHVVNLQNDFSGILQASAFLFV
jgi:hypothetical protein